MEFKTAHTLDEKERTQDIDIEENVTFEDMYLSDGVLSGLAACGFVRPSPIQLAAIPLGRCGLDLIVQAKSGTGKTCVFSVVALEMVSVLAKTTQVLIVAPTREIAVQIGQVMNSIGSTISDLRCSTFIGGTSLEDDKAKLKCCHIAVGTPGRLNQLVSFGILNLSTARLLVLDEADQLLASQFKDCILELVKALPLNKQVLALSATYSQEITQFLDKFMRSPSHVRLGKESPALIGVHQYVRLLPDHPQSHKRQKTKFSELLSILSTISFNQCLVFSNSQLRAESICNQLKSAGWPASYLTGGQIQEERLKAFFALCSYKCRILVSTDLSARGLDSEHVNMVINVDIPTDQATYLHRVGRAGRFGSKGVAITLVCEGEEWETMRAVATLTNVCVKILHENYDSNTFATESETSLERVLELTEADCALWLQKVNKRKRKGKEDKTDNKENMSSHTVTKSLSKSSLKQECKVVESVSEKKMKEIKTLEEDRVKKEESVESKALKEENRSNVKKALCNYITDFKVHSFSHDEVLKDIGEKWDTFSKEDTPNLTRSSVLNDYPSQSVFKSLELHVKQADQDSNASVNCKYSESTKSSFDPVEVLETVIRGEKFEFVSQDTIEVSQDCNGLPMLDNKDISENVMDVSRHSSNDEGAVNIHNYTEPSSKSHPTPEDSKNASPTKDNTEIAEIAHLNSDMNNLNLKTKANEVETKKKRYSENTGFGQWEVVTPKLKAKMKASPQTNCDDHFKESEKYDQNSYKNNCNYRQENNLGYSSYYSKVGSESMYNMQFSSNSMSGDSPSHYSEYCVSTDSYIRSAQKFGMMMEYVRNLGRMSAWIAQENNKAMLQSQQHPKNSHRTKKHQRNAHKKN